MAHEAQPSLPLSLQSPTFTKSTPLSLPWARHWGKVWWLLPFRFDQAKMCIWGSNWCGEPLQYVYSSDCILVLWYLPWSSDLATATFPPPKPTGARQSTTSTQHMQMNLLLQKVLKHPLSSLPHYILDSSLAGLHTIWHVHGGFTPEANFPPKLRSRTISISHQSQKKKKKREKTQ